MATDDFIPSEEELRANAQAYTPPKSMWEPITAPEPEELVLEDPAFTQETSSEDLHGVVPTPSEDTHEDTSEDSSADDTAAEEGALTHPDSDPADTLAAEEPRESFIEIADEPVFDIPDSDSTPPAGTFNDSVTERPVEELTDGAADFPEDTEIPPAIQPEELGVEEADLPEAEFASALEAPAEPALELAAQPTLEPTELSEQGALQAGAGDIALDTPEVTSTTTIPVVATSADDQYVPSDLLPNDVLEARDADNPSTTAIRRDLVTPQEDEVPVAPSWESTVVPPAAVRAPDLHPTGHTPDSLSDTIFEGATVVPVVPSRAKAHFASLFFGVFLIPAGWYLFADASARMLFPADAPVTTGQVSWLALGEFAAAIVVWLLFLVLTLRSSLGAWVWGIVLTLAGIPWLVVPGLMQQHSAAAFDWIELTGGVLGVNLAHHLQLSAYSGRLMLMGLTLLSMAIIAVSVRRRGRAEEALRAQVAKVNPEGAFLTRRERRRAEKAARQF